MREEQIFPAEGAQAQIGNILHRNTRIDELAPIGLGKIKENFLRQFAVAWSACGQKKQRIFFVDFISFLGFAKQLASVTELGFESGPYLRANFIAAPPNSRAYGSLQIAGIGSEPAVHFAYTFFHDAFHRPPPARMKDSNGSAF